MYILPSVAVKRQNRTIELQYLQGTYIVTTKALLQLAKHSVHVEFHNMGIRKAVQ